jgi:hypothetical protein
MFEKWMAEWKKRIRKNILAARLRDRGVCPEHGTKMTNRFNEEGSGFIVRTLVCDSCEEEFENSQLRAKQLIEDQTEAMLKEYRSL